MKTVLTAAILGLGMVAAFVAGSYLTEMAIINRQAPSHSANEPPPTVAP